MVTKIKAIYENEVVPYLTETFEYKNVHEIPKIEKIQILFPCSLFFKI